MLLVKVEQGGRTPPAKVEATSVANAASFDWPLEISASRRL